jgi:Mce-associated membrane protein
MPPRKLPAESLDTEDPGARVGQAATAIAEADEVAAAEARAQAARARAVRLRELADAASSDPVDWPDADDASDTEAERDDKVTLSEVEAKTLPRRWRRPSRKALAFAAAAVVICTSLSASGYIVWHHRIVGQQRERSAEFATTARDAVTAMMSIDPSKAREDMQRFSDTTTGIFKASVLMSAENFVKAIEQSKVRIKGTVQDVAVESMTKDSALVLVVAKSEIIKPDQAKPETRSWRMVVHVERDGSQLKVSKFEFVP